LFRPLPLTANAAARDGHLKVLRDVEVRVGEHCDTARGIVEMYTRTLRLRLRLRLRARAGTRRKVD